MSAFRKKMKSRGGSPSSNTCSAFSVSLRGTKPWINSPTLISSGQGDLDSIMGGGQALGTSTLILEDRWTDFGATLGRNWAAEGLANGQKLIVLDFDDLDDEFDRQLEIQVRLERSDSKSNSKETFRSSLRSSHMSNISHLDSLATPLLVTSLLASPRSSQTFLDSLPLDMNLAKAEKKRQSGQGPQEDLSSPSLSLANLSLTEGNEEEEGEDGEDFEEVSFDDERRLERRG